MKNNRIKDDTTTPGLAEVRAKGRAEGIMLTAKNLKSMGFSISDIMKATGLSEDDIMKL